MDRQEVERVIARLEDVTQGRGVELPSNDEIFAAFRYFDKHLPEKDARFAALAQTLAAPGLCLNAELAAEFRALHDRLETAMRRDAALAARLRHVPNHIPANERLANLLFAATLFLYAGVAAYYDDFYLPLRRRHGLHLHGLPVWIMEAATLCAIVVLLAVVVDHYDRRPNERRYAACGRFFRVLGWGLFVLALVAQFAISIGA